MERGKSKMITWKIRLTYFARGLIFFFTQYIIPNLIPILKSLHRISFTLMVYGIRKYISYTHTHIHLSIYLSIYVMLIISES